MACYDEFFWSRKIIIIIQCDNADYDVIYNVITRTRPWPRVLIGRDIDTCPPSQQCKRDGICRGGGVPPRQPSPRFKNRMWYTGTSFVSVSTIADVDKFVRNVVWKIKIRPPVTEYRYSIKCKKKGTNCDYGAWTDRYLIFGLSE